MDAITHDVTIIDNEITLTDKIKSITDKDEPTLEVLTPSILNAITHINKNKKRADIDAIFEYISKSVASNIDREFLNASVIKLVDNNVLQNEKTPKGDSYKIIDKQTEISDSVEKNMENDSALKDTPENRETLSQNEIENDSIFHKVSPDNDLKIMDEKIANNHFQINDLKQFVEEE